MLPSSSWAVLLVVLSGSLMVESDPDCGRDRYAHINKRLGTDIDTTDIGATLAELKKYREELKSRSLLIRHGKMADVDSFIQAGEIHESSKCDMHDISRLFKLDFFGGQRVAHYDRYSDECHLPLDKYLNKITLEHKVRCSDAHKSLENGFD